MNTTTRLNAAEIARAERAIARYEATIASADARLAVLHADFGDSPYFDANAEVVKWRDLRSSAVARIAAFRADIAVSL